MRLLPASKSGALASADDIDFIMTIGRGGGMFPPSAEIVASSTLKFDPLNPFVAASALRRKSAIADCVSLSSTLARFAGRNGKIHRAKLHDGLKLADGVRHAPEVFVRSPVKPFTIFGASLDA